MVRTPIATFPETDGPVEAALLYKGVLYIGGAFTTVGGLSRFSLAAIDPNNGQVLPFNPLSAPSNITSITALKNILYVGSAAITIRTASGNRQGAAAFSLDGTLQAWNPDLNDAVRTLDNDGTSIYLGGEFTTLTGGVTTRNRAAKVNAVSGIPDGWNPSLNAVVSKIFISGQYAYLAGNFTTVNGGTVRNHAASFDLVGGTVSVWNPDFSSAAQDLVVLNGKVFVAGSFVTLNAGTVPRMGFAATDLSGVALPMDLQLNAASNSISVIHNKILLGGAFVTILGQPRNYFAIINRDGTLSDFDMNANSGILASAFTDNRGVSGLVLGGVFTTPRQHLAAFYDPALSIPRTPKISFLNRKKVNGHPSLTVLKWQPVSMDINNNYTVTTGYRVYRTSSLNLENPVLVAEITTLDIRGVVDTMFTEEIDGFFKYCVSAFNPVGESGKSCIASVAQAQSDRI